MKRNTEIKLEVNNLDNSPVEEDFLRLVFEKTIEESGLDFLVEGKIGLSLAWVSQDEIKKLNQKYRQKNASTDVLSFCEFEDQNELEKALEESRRKRGKTEESLFLGELVLCYNDIEDYASEKKLDLEKEIAKVASHGLLHLLGFSHGEKMFGIQDRVALNFFKL